MVLGLARGFKQVSIVLLVYVRGHPSLMTCAENGPNPFTSKVKHFRTPSCSDQHAFYSGQ